MDRSGEKVLQVDHDGGLAMMSVMTSTMTGEIMAIDNAMMAATMTGGKDIYPER